MIAELVLISWPANGATYPDIKRRAQKRPIAESNDLEFVASNLLSVFEVVLFDAEDLVVQVEGVVIPAGRVIVSPVATEAQRSRVELSRRIQKGHILSLQLRRQL